MGVMRHRNAVAALVVAFMVGLAPEGLLSQEHSEARKILMRVTPQYPTLANSMHIQGIVKADVIVAPNGTVRSVEVKGGHPLLAQSAQNALQQWKWEPAPHETRESIELRFTP
jgi:TonB family protein